MKSYKDLKIYEEAMEISLKIRHESVKLPNVDKYEVGSQIRRSSQSIKDNIVEGYGRRKYKADFIKHLIYSHASLLEAQSQAEFLNRLHKNDVWGSIANDLNKLGARMNAYIKYVENNWK